MLKSKPLIIVLTVLSAIVGAWAGMHAFTSGAAQIGLLVLLGVIGYFVYKGLRGNRRVETVTHVERSALLGEPSAGTARALVYREGFIAKLSGFDIAVDGVPRSQLKSPQSVAIDLAPGDHQLTVKIGGKDQPPFPFAVSAGEVAILRVGMGIAGCEISREEGAQARAKLAAIPMVRPDGAPRAAEARMAPAVQ